MITTKFERVLALFDGDDPGTRATKIRAYQLILALVLFTEYWMNVFTSLHARPAEDYLAPCVASVLGAMVLSGRWRRVGFSGFALLGMWKLWNIFPMAANHTYLEILICALFAVLDDEREDEQRLLLRSLRWIVVVVLFYSGVQKLVHGYYFGGQFLTYSMWRASFRLALEPLLSAEEFARLSSYTGVTGDGPYTTRSPALLLLTNVIWIAEIGLAILLVPRTTRPFAWIASAVFFMSTQVVARELIFGIQFASALALFSRNDLIRRWVWPVAALLALMLLVRLGIAPQVSFN